MKWTARSGIGRDFRRSLGMRRQIAPRPQRPAPESGFPCGGKPRRACVNSMVPSSAMPAAMLTPVPAITFSPLLPEHLIILRSGRWFHDLPRALAQQLTGLARIRQLAAGEAVFLRGDPPGGLYAVLRGTLHISSASEGPHGKLLTLLEAPAWFGELSLFDESARSHDVHAIEPSWVLQVPQAPLLQWLDQHPEHWRPMALLLTLKLRLAVAALEDQSVLAAPQRVARRLATMAEDYGLRLDTTQSRRVLRLSQEQLARMLALSRQTTNQILQDLQQRGMIRLYRGKLEILDLARLRDSAQAARH